MNGLLSASSLGGPELIIIVFLLIFSLATTAFWLWVLVDCVTKEPAEGDNRMIWVLVVALAGFIGAAVYFFARRPQRIALVGK